MKWMSLAFGGRLLIAVGLSTVAGQTALAQSDALRPPADSASGLLDQPEAPPAGSTQKTGAGDGAAVTLWDRFSGYDPMYFSFGWRGGFHAKFQVSLKYRLVSEESNLASKPFLGALNDFYFGYTQLSIWDLGEESSPFRDTNYKPTMFYDKKDLLRRRPDWVECLGVRAGFEHESNGQDQDDSRSINSVFIRPRLVFGDEDKLHFEIAPKAYYYVGDLSDNDDIADYRGYVDLGLKLGCGDSWQLASTLRRGTERHYGSVQVDFSMPFRQIFRMPSLGGYLHVQYFNGWGETLIDYNRKRESQIRVGIMIQR